VSRAFDVIVLTPAALGDPALAIAALRAGHLGILNAELPLPLPARDAALARLAATAAETGRPFGLALSDPETAAALVGRHGGQGLSTLILPADAALAAPETLSAIRAAGVRVILEAIRWDPRLTGPVVSEGLIVKGHEAGGRVGEATSFILLQQAIAGGAAQVFVRGGVGLHSTAALRIGGAAGVVLDDQTLALRESTLPPGIGTVLARMTGAETVLIEGANGIGWRGMEQPGQRAAARLRTALAADPATQDTTAPTAFGWNIAAGQIAPLGQAAAFAPDLARRYGSLGRLARALIDDSAQAVARAAAHPAFAENTGVAVPHATRWPIVQGPMTRVSDTAAFAESVATGGALPMVALALMRPAQADTLLADVAQRLQGRSWGVGLLGFAPAALIKAQVEVALKHKPAFALIAGGRPDQARAMEEDGIPSYLHVPSPRLLTMFLEQGAGRFVFEGRECGGHVGPMSSLVLWDQMVRTLLSEVADPARAAQISVLFAGGIHDARSAAMVAAFAAPLAERGIRTGVLMGTAYLFTQEAVDSGSIVPAFQETLLTCTETVTLETGAGHASRAAMSPFAAEFAARRRELEAQGVGAEDMREALESLTLGRLRIASKATERQGDDLLTVPEERQLAEGMYMIGQAAQLRDQVTTIDALHREIAEGSAAILAAAAETPRPVPARPAAPRPADVAIVGLSAMLPGADDVANYWENLLDGVDAITEIPRHRWDWRLYFDADPTVPDKIYSKWGGFLPDMPFDPMRYGLPPRSLPAIDPLQLMTLELARRCLADAGYDGPDAPPGPRLRTSVILGASGGAGDVGAQYAVRSEMTRFLGQIDPDAAARLPEWTEDSFAGILLNVAAGRTANRLDFGGVNYTVDAACASSLAAVYQAVLELETGRSDMVLAGGIDTVQGPFGYLCFSKTRALSPRGRCRSFEADADGIVISEGLAMVALKRLADAERDGDRIYAVIKGVGGSSDGKAKSMTAPHPDGQVRALSRAYEMAGYSPATVGLFEAHGTGTVAGDTSEMTTVTRLLTEAGAAPRQSAIGSVKTLIGHTKAAAGIAGLIKATLACHHAVLPPHGRRGAPNPRLTEPDIPLYLVDRPRPWLSPADTPRRAGVSAFGFGGTNFHVTLEEYAGQRAIPALAPAPRARWSHELLLWRAPTRAALAAQVQAQADRLKGATPALAALAASLAAACPPNGLTAALVVARSEPLADRIAALAAHLADPARPLPPGASFSEAPLLDQGKLALVFPGQGSQYPEMLADLATLFPAMAESLTEADATLGEPLSRLILPAGAYDDAALAAAAQALTPTDIAQPALGAVEAGLWAILSDMGLAPDMACGHSYGEFAALHAAGVLSRPDLFRVSRARGRFMVEAGAGGDLGTMAAARAPREDLEKLIAGIEGVCVANHNAPEQSILSGTRAAIAEATARAEKAGIPLRPLQVGAAFHSPIVAPAAERLGAFLQDIPRSPAAFPVYANATAAPYPDDPAAVPDLLARQLAAPVEFVAEVMRMHDDGARVFLSLGPKAAHATMVRQILGPRPHRAIATDDEAGGLKGLLQAVGALLAEGARLDVSRLWHRRVTDVIPLKGPLPEPEPPGRHLWLLNGSGARPIGQPPAPVLTLEDVAARAARPAPLPAAPLAAQAPAPRPATLPAPRKETLPMDGQPHDTGTDGTGLHDPGPDLMPLDPAAAIMADFQATMMRFLETQERVMLASLGQAAQPRMAAPLQARALPVRVQAPRLPMAAPVARPAPVAAPAAARPAPVATAAPAAAPAPVAQAPAPVAPAPAAGLDRAGISALLLSIVEDRTGYPADMLGLDQGIESDLGIDSIKRLEIVGALIKALPPAQAEAATPIGETLNAQKTLGAIIDTLATHLDGAPMSAPEKAAAPFDLAGAENAGSTTARPPRFVIVAEAAPLPPFDAPLPPGRYLIAGADAGLAVLLATRISAAGGTPIALDPAAAETAPGPFAGLVHLAPLAIAPVALTDPPARWWASVESADKAAYRLVRAHADGLSTGRMLLATALGGRFARDTAAPDGLRLAGGSTGLAKSLRREWPESRPKAIDLDPATPPEAMADILMAELAAPFGRIEVGYPGGIRTVFRSIATDLAAPARDLPSGAVILATGGARGITAEILRPFAAREARLVLMGRTPLPGVEDPTLACLTETGALRRHLAAAARTAGEDVTPALIERRLAAIQRDREIVANLADLRTAGAAIDYIVCDMADPAAVATAIARIRDDIGPIHGVIHGAGVIEDRRITDKTPDSWDRVVTPKIMGALALAAALDAAPPAFFAVFASVAGRYGNAGQTDYAAANELLNRIAAQLSARWPATHALAVNWGPWDATRHGAGMVSDGVRQKFESQGVTLVSAEGGAQAFFDEILMGDRPEVTLGAGPWESHETDCAAEPAIAPPEQEPAARPLLPAALPEPGPKGGTAIRRRIALDTDPWIGEHRLGGTPVLPLAVAAEFAAEAAAAIWPDWQVAGLSDLRLLNGLRLEDDAPRDIDIVGTSAEHGDATGFSARVELFGRIGRVARPHYRASVHLAPPGGTASDEDQSRALSLTGLRLAPPPIDARRAYRELLFHGPAYQAMRAITGLDARGLTATVAPSDPGSFGIGAGWLFDPGLLDTAAQLAWVWSTVQHGAPALPNAIGRLLRLAHGTPAHMAFTLRDNVTPPQVLADVVVTDAAGTPLLLIEGLESTSDAGLARFCGWTGAIRADISGGTLSEQAAE
jgi:acyl transferase domain-containing protein/NADP-dependent 3-hydroxy acid dehydrogenase YdfG